jgi:hypothetical protein
VRHDIESGITQRRRRRRRSGGGDELSVVDSHD